ncbi:MAG TPA: peptidoglycan-binding protein [Burkholderiaceae bacterium]|nr:peptidoglycan-binding protein [Burkholderiaceae bacterium]
MSRLLKSLSSLVNGHADRSPSRDVAPDTAPPDAGPSTLSTPLYPLDTRDDEPRPPARGHAAAAPRDTSTEGAETVSPRSLVPMAPQAATTHRGARKSPSSRALNAVVRATTQVALPSHVEPTPAPKVVRTGHRSTVVLTETERLRLQIMQVQLKLTGLQLYDGAIDGTMNPDLVDGVRHFQTLKGMRDSGMLTTGTLAALGIRPID